MKNFKYTNLNPMGLNESDCVSRAISYATRQSYFRIRRQLRKMARIRNAEELNVNTYKYLIEKIYHFKPVRIPINIKAGEFATIYNKGIYIIRMDGHASIVDNGIIRDTWNCSYKIVTHAWRVN